MTSDWKTANDWIIPERRLPPPSGASAEVCAILAAEAAPQPFPMYSSLEEMAAGARESDAARIAQINEAIPGLGITINQLEIGGVPVYEVVPGEPFEIHAEHLFLHIHGGAFLYGAGLACTAEAVEIAAQIGIRVLSIDYRMVPDHPAPAALDDCLAVWQELIRTTDPNTVVVGGTSAGGNLTLAMALKARLMGLPRPGCLFVGTPCVDMAPVGDSRFLNTGVDRLLWGWEGSASQPLEIYTRDVALDDPGVSPIHGDFTDFPPTYLISGTRDLLLSDTVRVHRAIRNADSIADLHVYEGMAHADYVLMQGTPEYHEHFMELDAFIQSWLIP